MEPDDLKGLKIRVQTSPTNVKMLEALGASPTPMSFGEVYTGLQQNVIDGAENNELALTSNKHGEVAKYFSYNKHQMIPDLLIGNLSFLNGLSKEERKVFYKAAELSNEEECKQWDVQVKEAKKVAQEQMGVKFIDVDVLAFQKKVKGVQESILKDNAQAKPIYDHIQKVNKKYEGKDGE